MTNKIIVANWKMNKTTAEAREFFSKFTSLLTDKHNHSVVICPSFISLEYVSAQCKKLKIECGAQNVHHALRGTFTGEVSAEMLAECGAKYVIVGHSERRVSGERDAQINKKIRMAREHGITSILCVGESAYAREVGTAYVIIKRQLQAALRGSRSADNLIIAYEPVWAISGGDPSKPNPIPSAEEIETMHAYIKNCVRNMFKTEVKVLYGGSANEKNARQLLDIPGVDGLLVGGAGLDPERFARMINC